MAEFFRDEIVSKNMIFLWKGPSILTSTAWITGCPQKYAFFRLTFFWLWFKFFLALAFLVNISTFYILTNFNLSSPQAVRYFFLIETNAKSFLRKVKNFQDRNYWLDLTRYSDFKGGGGHNSPPPGYLWVKCVEEN